MSESAPDSGPEACWLVTGGGGIGAVAALPDGIASGAGGAGPLVRVEAAGFNYKDALACAGHPGVARTLPLVPGIDLAGTLLEPAAGLPCGAPIVATGNGLGETRHGGFATLARPPATAVLARPPGLSAVEAMALGTAGLTVLLAVDRLDRVAPPGHPPPADAEWLVTGASGGVGMLAVAALAAAGRRVVACTRKATAATTLRGLGAESVVTPDAIGGAAGKSLIRGRWAGAIDCVGGPILADVLKGVVPGGCVAAIGMAAGPELATTVHPFILRGVTLCGIDAAALPTPAERAALWPRLAGLWPRVRDLLPLSVLALDEVGEWAAALLAGSAAGRAVVQPAARVEPRHSINLSGAWEVAGAGTEWRRRFGLPTGLEPGDAVRLAWASPPRAVATLNGVALARLEPGRAWAHRVTHLLQDRNELVLACDARPAAGGDDASRLTLPEPLGRPKLEIIRVGSAP